MEKPVVVKPKVKTRQPVFLSWVFLFSWELMAIRKGFLNTRGRRTIFLKK